VLGVGVLGGGVLDAGEETGGNGTFWDWIWPLLGAGEGREWEVVARCGWGVRGAWGVWV